MQMVPVEKDALDGPGRIEVFARVAAQAGEPDRAIAALQRLATMSYQGPFAGRIPLTSALLRLDPMFDALRADSRFRDVAASFH
jgi:hypothetical protein